MSTKESINIVYSDPYKRYTERFTPEQYGSVKAAKEAAQRRVKYLKAEGFRVICPPFTCILMKPEPDPQWRW